MHSQVKHTGSSVPPLQLTCSRWGTDCMWMSSFSRSSRCSLAWSTMAVSSYLMACWRLCLVHACMCSATANIEVVPSLHGFWCSFSLVSSLLTVSWCRSCCSCKGSCTLPRATDPMHKHLHPIKQGRSPLWNKLEDTESLSE